MFQTSGGSEGAQGARVRTSCENIGKKKKKKYET